MSASIVEQPFIFDFVNNNLIFKLTGTPISVTGRKAVTRYKINAMPQANHYLMISYGTKAFEFIVKTTTSALQAPFEIFRYSSLSELKTELETKIAKNYYIARDFNVTVSDTLEITFTAKQNGGNTVTLQSTDSSANIQLLSTTTGVEMVEKAGYRIFAKLEVTRIVGGVTKTEQTPEILLHVDSDNRVSLPLSLLCSYLTAVDIPAPNESFAARSLKYALLKYRLVYSDYFNDTIQVLQYSDERYLVNGEMSESYRGINISDWSCPIGSSNKLSSFGRPRSYGSSSGLTVKSYSELPQYAYFMFFYTREVNSYTSSLEVRIDILNEDGSTVTNINPGAITLTNFSIARIPLSVKALSLANHSTQILSYTVRIFHAATPAAAWTRTFIMQEKPFYAKEFLLQNKYGVLESFFIDNETIKKTVDGEKITCNGKIKIDITDVSTVFTARTGYKSDIEMKLLSEAVENRFHYKIVNGELIPVIILPDTLTILDEAEDLQTVEFQYMFNTPKSTSGETTGGNSGGTTTTYMTFIDSVWAAERTWNDISIFTVNNDTQQIINNMNIELIQNGMELSQVRSILNNMIQVLNNQQEQALGNNDLHTNFAYKAWRYAEPSIRCQDFELTIPRGAKAVLVFEQEHLKSGIIVDVEAFRRVNLDNTLYNQRLDIGYRVAETTTFGTTSYDIQVVNLTSFEINFVKVYFKRERILPR